MCVELDTFYRKSVPEERNVCCERDDSMRSVPKERNVCRVMAKEKSVPTNALFLTEMIFNLFLIFYKFPEEKLPAILAPMAVKIPQDRPSGRDEEL